MTFQTKALKQGRIDQLKVEIADIENQLAKGWIWSPPDCYYPILEELASLEVDHDRR